MSNNPMTVKEFDECVERLFFLYTDTNNLSTFYLCILFRCTIDNSGIRSEWDSYWGEVNTRRYRVLPFYFAKKHRSPETNALLRLLVIEDFKKHLINKGILV